MTGRIASWAFFLTSALRSSTDASKYGRHAISSSLGIFLAVITRDYGDMLEETKYLQTIWQALGQPLEELRL
jgi:hypothetical protein